MIDLAIDDRVKIDTIFDAALQELDMLFNTKCTELIGDPEFGSNWEKFLWDYTVSDEAIKRYIQDIIRNNTYFLKYFDYKIDIEEQPGEIRSIFVILVPSL
ncbi:hypothetical protein [Sharpea azabuensis]|uniref:hypothetical protein n=1 Tax=Sharpea azabuensis TaxID=322505 RepID=UPI002E81EFE8|nr:hypothetical protein [Sharpea azabuensis]MEE3308977.1 hypothetical protein [Sharpea azabuensis]